MSDNSLEATALREFGTQSDSSGARQRYFFLDSLRAVAALVVVVTHITQLVPVPYIFNPIGDLSEDAVALFIVVSGYSLGLAAFHSRDGRYRTFVRRRAWRILPPYWAALGITVALSATVLTQRPVNDWGYAIPFDWSEVWRTLLLVQDVTRVIRVPDYPLWSIAVEWHLYFLLPPLVWWTARRFGRIGVFLSGVIVSALLWIPWDRSPVDGFPPQLALLFFVGVIASSMTTREDQVARNVRRLFSPYRATGLALITLAASEVVDRGTNGFVGVVLFGIGFAPILVAYANAPGFVGRRLLERRPLVWLGMFSYSLYLVHAPLIELVWQYVIRPLGLGPTPTILLAIAVAMPIAVAGSFLFHLLFERPFINNRSLHGVLGAYRNPRSLLGDYPSKSRRSAAKAEGAPPVNI